MILRNHNLSEYYKKYNKQLQIKNYGCLFRYDLYPNDVQVFYTASTITSFCTVLMGGLLC